MRPGTFGEVGRVVASDGLVVSTTAHARGFHSNAFRDAGARCVLVELDPKVLERIAAIR